MSYVMVDTNVLIVANGKSSQASPQCVLDCIQRLREIKEGQKILVLDEGGLIFEEYKKNLSFSKKDAGHAFFQWVHVNRYNPQKCQLVQITEISEYNFAEFPQDEALAKFDLSDRKWVAVALVHPAKPPILNAVDSDWRDFRAQLAAHGVQVEFLCPDVLS